MADEVNFQTLSPVQLSIAVGFLMSRLPDDVLAELDAMLDGDKSQVAEDAAFKNKEALAWVQMNSHTRHAVRQSKRDGRNKFAADRAATLERFPNMDRIR